MAFKIILKENYRTYQHALNILQLKTLEDRRKSSCLTLATKCLSNSKIKHLFPPNNRTHQMIPRQNKHFQITHANTERLKESPIIYMQNLLNEEVNRIIEIDRIWKD